MLPFQLQGMDPNVIHDRAVADVTHGGHIKIQIIIVYIYNYIYQRIFEVLLKGGR